MLPKLLTTKDIAEIMQLAHRTVQNVLVKQAGFPKPIVPLRGRAKRWRQEDVQKWIRNA